MKIKTIISDLGGVFLNKGIWIFWGFLQDKYNIPFDKSKDVFLKYYKEYFSGKIAEEKFWKSFLTDLGLDIDWMETRKVLLNFFEVNEEVVKLYATLRKKGLKLVLLSDQTKEWWPILDAKFNVSSCFDVVVVSALVGLNKPDPEIYKYALGKSESKADEALFIDDLEQNLIPAKELGITTILFENFKKLRDQLITMEILTSPQVLE